MTKPKVPTAKAKAFGQAPKADRAQARAPLSRRQTGPQRLAKGGPTPSADYAERVLRIPFKNQSHIYQPPEAAAGDDDIMGQQQN